MAPQLKAIGITPADIKYIGISHNHADHTGNIHQFKNSTVLIQRNEYEQAFTGAAAPAGPPNFQGQIFERNHPVRLLDGDYDVFGDGSVILFYVGRTYPRQPGGSGSSAQHGRRPVQRRFCSLPIEFRLASGSAGSSRK